MKLGTKEASPLETLDDVVLHVQAEYATDEEMEAAGTSPLDDEEISIFWEEARREAIGRKKLFAAANAARLERELRVRLLVH